MMTNSTIRSVHLLLVDGSKVFRNYLREFIELSEGVRVIGEAGNEIEAMAACEALHPNFVLLDISVPEKGGIQIAREIKTTFPNIGIALLTEHDPAFYTILATSIGADAVIQKDFLAKDLPKMLNGISRHKGKRKRVRNSS